MEFGFEGNVWNEENVRGGWGKLRNEELSHL
jgi:hypothetical protein